MKAVAVMNIQYSSTTKRYSDLNLNIVNIIAVKRSFFPEKKKLNMDLDLSALSHEVIGEGQMKFPWKLMLRLFGLLWLNLNMFSFDRKYFSKIV